MIGRRVSKRFGGLRRASGVVAAAALCVALAPAPARAQLCGNGMLDTGEQCDTGSLLGTGCCLLGCLLAPAGLECRAAEGACDLPETCDGLVPVCPTNRFKAVEVCRPAAGPCDLEESCIGVGPACPTNSLAPPSLTCRLPVTACDLPELCTGSSIDCPADTGEPDGDLDGTCDRQDVCPLVADPTQADSDADGAGDVCDPCTNVGDIGLDGPRMGLAKLSAPPDDDRLRLKTTFEVPLEPAIDPVEKGMRLVLSGPLGVVFDAILPPGSFDGDTRAGWRQDGEGRWSYKNASDEVPRPAGIKRLTLRQHGASPNLFRLVVGAAAATCSPRSGSRRSSCPSYSIRRPPPRGSARRRRSSPWATRRTAGCSTAAAASTAGRSSELPPCPIAC
jgi:hypothetical protein